MRILKRIGSVLLFVMVAICLAPTVVPPFLDRIYYRGPISDHFDGGRFFNPEDREPVRGSPVPYMTRFVVGQGRATWPETVPVTQGYPPTEATLCPPLKGAVVENWRRCVDQVDPKLMAVTWIGHSTVLIQAGGLNILTDPVWSDRVSPVSFAGPKRVRMPGIRLEDLPKIDLILVSHNHYDHLDLATLDALWRRDRPAIVTTLGNDAIIGKADVRARAIDWGGSASGRNWRVTILRNHHWSSRWGSDRNRALWSAFSIDTPAGRIFFAGDTGWGDGSWAHEAARRGPYRLAIIPIGAYEPRDVMESHHINPEEAVRVFQALRPTQALGVHWGTFQLTFEPIDDPRQKLEALKRGQGIPANRFIATEVGQPFRVPLP